MPHSLARVSWIFVLVSIGLLAIAGQDFLVNITDFMVLVSLGLISLSAIWIRKIRTSFIQSSDVLPLIVGLSCFVAAGGVYFIQASVAVFGSIAIAIAYLIYDVLELGAFGVQLFLGVFDAITYIALVIYPHASFSQSFFYFPFSNLLLPLISNTALLEQILISSTILLFANLSIDLLLARKAAKKGQHTEASRIKIKRIA